MSLLVAGRPQWFQLALTIIELVLPTLLFWLSTAGEKKTPTSDQEFAIG